MNLVGENVVTKTFMGKQIQFVDIDERRLMSLHDIGEALGYASPRKGAHNLYKRAEDELTEWSTVLNLRIVEGGREVEREVILFDERGVMIMTMLSRQPNAKLFRKWAVDVLYAYRQGVLTTQRPEPPAYDKQLTDMIIQAGKGNAYAERMLRDRYSLDVDSVHQAKPYMQCPVCHSMYPYNDSHRRCRPSMGLPHSGGH